MTPKDIHNLSADEWDELNFPRPEGNDFDKVVERAISRRGFLGGVLAFGSGAAVMGAGMLKGSTAMAQPASRFPFTPIAAQTDGTIHVPEGYSWKTVVRWGDALFSDAEDAFDPATGVSLEHADRVMGENTDGMELFNVDGREIFVVNSEYVNPKVNLPHTEDGMPKSLDDVRILQSFQGVTVMELAQGDDGWNVVIDSPYNRRIHHNTPMTFSGPAAGHDLLKTEADPTGMESLGTFNNCGSGRTPWGTYLTCEENFNGYFGAVSEVSADSMVMDGFRRYGVSTKVDAGRYNYHGFDPRFDVATNPNEPHRAGYIVEIDPANPDSTPIKHTALGRFKHENAAYGIAGDGRVVVYMGDDERGELIPGNSLAPARPSPSSGTPYEEHAWSYHPTTSHWRPKSAQWSCTSESPSGAMNFGGLSEAAGGTAAVVTLAVVGELVLTSATPAKFLAVRKVNMKRAFVPNLAGAS